MEAALVPWEPSSITKWAFMDDRSMVAGGAEAHADMTAGLAYKQKFDSDSAMKENQSKRKLDYSPMIISRQSSSACSLFSCTPKLSGPLAARVVHLDSTCNCHDVHIEVT